MFLLVFLSLLSGITFPSGESQYELIAQVYEECGVNPHNVSYVEAHGTGTKAGDPVELNALTAMFCKGRTTPLRIGSTKSNMGHPESSSGIDTHFINDYCCFSINSCIFSSVSG